MNFFKRVADKGDVVNAQISPIQRSHMIELPLKEPVPRKAEVIRCSGNERASERESERVPDAIGGLVRAAISRTDGTGAVPVTLALCAWPTDTTCATCERKGQQQKKQPRNTCSRFLFLCQTNVKVSCSCVTYKQRTTTSRPSRTRLSNKSPWASRILNASNIAGPSLLRHIRLVVSPPAAPDTTARRTESLPRLQPVLVAGDSKESQV